MMQQYRSILFYGFAIFAMFFGSGNLVFPLQIGSHAGANWLAGFGGLLLTGIFLPLLGLFVIKRYHGHYQRFFNEVGDIAGLLLPAMMLALLGSFGVVPRCIIVAFGSVNYLFPQISLLSFSFVFCLITFFFCLNDQFMVNVLGRWMSPILLLALIVLITIAVITAPAINDMQTIEKHAFKFGFLTGYQTMDLFAAFFFSSLVFQQIQRQFPTASLKDIVFFAVKSSVFGATLLAIVYAGLVYLGAHYSLLINHIKPELMLPTIAALTMGSVATLFMAIIMFFSCLTTAIALNNLFARYLCTVLKQDSDKFIWLLLLTTVLSFIISLLDFKGIAAFLAPILQSTYPAIITLTLMCILIESQQRLKMIVFYSITVLMGCITIVNFVNQ
jgi:LIVCS family branched-chain amino acid:cation transporter